MRILALADALHPLGGLERCHLDICRELDRRGDDSSLAYLRDGGLRGGWAEFTSSDHAVRSTRILPRQPWRTSMGLASAARILSAQRVDLVYASHYRQLQLATLVARVRGVPLVLHIHNVAPASLGPIGRHIVGLPDRVMAVSRSAADQWHAIGVRPERTRIVHNGVDLERFHPPDDPGTVAGLRAAHGIAADAFVVTFLGGTAEGKGAGVLLDAWTRIGLTSDEGRLMLAGRPDAETRRRLDRMGPHDTSSICEVGHVADVIPLLQLADVVAVPSNGHDPCPLSVLEGLACGRPVVAATIGGIPELLTGELASLLVRPGDATDLADALDRLRRRPEQRRGLGDACRAHAVAHFSLDRLVDDVQRVFAEATASQPCRRGRSRGPLGDDVHGPHASAGSVLHDR